LQVGFAVAAVHLEEELVVLATARVLDTNSKAHDRAFEVEKRIAAPKSKGKCVGQWKITQGRKITYGELYENIGNHEYHTQNRANLCKVHKQLAYDSANASS
jgi:hypothetical protein